MTAILSGDPSRHTFLTSMMILTVLWILIILVVTDTTVVTLLSRVPPSPLP
jgi:hypothetical protein